MVYNDIHGVKQLLDKVTGTGIGPEYQSGPKWQNGVSRDIYPDDNLQTQDLDTATGTFKDTFVDFNCHGWLSADQNKGKIDGGVGGTDGLMTLRGSQPRCYIYDTANPTTRQWRNFEFTAFCKLVALKAPGPGETAVPTMSLRGRTHHHRYGWCNCNGSGYIAQVIPGSRKQIEFRKEYAHACYNDSKTSTYFDFQMNKWYGFKFILQGKNNPETEVQMKFYTCGEGTLEGDKQTWNLRASLTDNGTNMPINHVSAEGPDIDRMPSVVAGCTSNCIDSSPVWQQPPYKAIINMRGCCVYLRGSWVEDLKFKWVNVHEVAAAT